MATKKRRKNPQDATLRNVRAAKKRDVSLQAQITYVMTETVYLTLQLAAIRQRLDAIERRRNRA